MDRKTRRQLLDRLESYFWPESDDNGCWFWLGPTVRGTRGRPYGYFVFEGVRYSARPLAHRLWIGPTKGRRVELTCGHSLCVCPAHMILTRHRASPGRPRKV